MRIKKNMSGKIIKEEDVHPPEEDVNYVNFYS